MARPLLSHAILMKLHLRWDDRARVMHLAIALAAYALLSTLASLALTNCSPSPAPTGPDLEGTIHTLSDVDTLLFDDGIGSLTEETTGTGKPIGSFAAYPYGLTRFDSSSETRKYANSPRDVTVGLDAMGARAYAPDLGVWTSVDPVAVEDPMRSVGGPLGAANPYGYAGQTPVVATDEDGHFWHIAIAAALGSAIGAATEAYQQYSATGHIESWGRVEEHAVATGAAFSLAAALPSPVTMAEAFTLAAGGNALTGMANRLVDSGGKSAGTVGQVAADYAKGGVTGGLAFGAAKVFANAASAVAARATPSRIPTSQSWGNSGTLARHFAEHGADFGSASAEAYAHGASAFLQRTQTEGLPTKIDASGVIRAFDPATRTFGAFNPDGTTRTFFRPSSPTYWLRQPGEEPWAPKAGPP